MAHKFPKSAKYNFNKNLVKRHKLVTHLDRFLADDPIGFSFEYEPKVPDNAWHPSGHCMPSATELYDIATAPPTPRDIPVSLQKTFMVGHFWHQLLQFAVVEMELADTSAIEARGHTWWGDPVSPEDTDELEYGKMGLFFGRYSEQKDGRVTEDQIRSWPTTESGVIRPQPYHWATGQADVAPCVIPGLDPYLVDFKTMASHQFKTNGIPAWAAYKYEAQINIYMNWFNLDHALIVAINKDSPHEMKEFEFEYNEPLVNEIYHKWGFVSECIATGEAPSKLDDDEFILDDLFKGPIAQ